MCDNDELNKSFAKTIYLQNERLYLSLEEFRSKTTIVSAFVSTSLLDVMMHDRISAYSKSGLSDHLISCDIKQEGQKTYLTATY